MHGILHFRSPFPFAGRRGDRRQPLGARRVSASTCKTDPYAPKTWWACAALLPHAQAALSVGSDGMGRVANSAGASGSYAAARELWRTIADARAQTLGPEHPATLNARAEVASWTGMAGDAARARDQFAALLPVDERVLGPEHPDTLTACHNLARWTGEAGDAAGACDLYAALLPVKERVLGPEHPDTRDTRVNLAYWAGKANSSTTPTTD